MAEPLKRTKALIRRWEKGQAAKGQWMSHWDDVTRVQNPRREGFVTTQTEGARRTDDLFDGSPQVAARGLANAVGGMIRPEGEQWPIMRAEDDRLDNSDEVKEWLSDSQRRLLTAIYSPRARFRQATGEVDLDLVTIATGVMFVGEGRSLNHLLFQSLWLRDAVPVFNEEGAIDGMFVKRRFTLRNAMARFGEDNLSAQTREKLSRATRDEALDEKLDLLHAVVLREEGRADALIARELPFADIWIEIDQKHEISVGGFHEFPFVVPRWDTSSGEDYGRSPGMIALPDSDTAQAMGETLLIAGQRAADPPLAVPNDSAFAEYNTFPGGLLYYDTEAAAAVRGNPFFPLSPGSNMPLTLEMQQDIRNNIFAAFFRNVLNLPIEGPQMTATEVIQRKEEFIREIGPVFGRLETDYTAPMVERAFNIMLRAGALAPIPEALQGQNIRFEYESPVKRIRKQIEAAAAGMVVAEALNIAQIKPEIMDSLNLDEYIRFRAEAAGLPTALLTGRDELQAMREARAEADQAAQQMQVLQQGAEIADRGAGAVQKAAQAQQPPQVPQPRAA